MSEMRDSPSRRLYSEWTCRCTNSVTTLPSLHGNEYAGHGCTGRAEGAPRRGAHSGRGAAIPPTTKSEIFRDPLGRRQTGAQQLFFRADFVRGGDERFGRAAGVRNVHRIEQHGTAAAIASLPPSDSTRLNATSGSRSFESTANAVKIERAGDRRDVVAKPAQRGDDRRARRIVVFGELGRVFGGAVVEKCDAHGVSDCGLRIADCGLRSSNPQSAIRNPQFGRFDDPLNQFHILAANRGPQHRQVGMRRMQAGERIDFHELRIAVFVAAQVEPARVAAADGSPGGQRDSLRFRDLRIVVGRDQRELAPALRTAPC